MMAVVATAAVVLVLAGREAVFFHHRTATVTVCRSEPVARSDHGGYRIHTAVNGTFIIKDTHAFTQWRTDSADVYGLLHERRTYEVSYVNFRFSLLSWFPNITSFKQVETNVLEVAKCDD